MRRLTPLLTLLAVAVLAAGCDESLNDPATDQLVGTWVASKLGATFSGSSMLELEFKSGGALVVTQGTEQDGTYSATSSSADPDIRNISLTYGGSTVIGVYKIESGTMRLELVPSTATTKPSAELGVGSTGEANVSILTKQ